MNIETVHEEPPSLIKFQPPIDITHKLDSYRRATTPQYPHDAKLSTQDILNIILPPRQWSTPNHEVYMQYVSHDKPERQDVELVQKKLEQALLKMQARIDGICPIRESLFAQVFDEIIRQVTLDCPERGVMLMRVRDERRMTIAGYQTVYEEGKGYGVRRQIEAEESVDGLQEQVAGLEMKRVELERRREVLMSKKGSIQQKFRERQAVESEKREYEIAALLGQNKHLQSFLEKRRKVTAQLVKQPVKEQEDV